MTIKIISSDNAEQILVNRRGHGMILSALNLFMLGFLKQHRDFPQHAVFWCDGLMGELYILLKGGATKRMRGVEMLKVTLAANKGRSVSILGSCSEEAKAELSARQIHISDHNSLELFNLDIFDCNKITLSSDVVIITLPSPKQELLAIRLASIQANAEVHFYCIGGALNMLANPKLDCPYVLQKLGLEFLFRLRTDTLRRISRLISSLFLALSNARGLLKQNIIVIKDWYL